MDKTNTGDAQDISSLPDTHTLELYATDETGAEKRLTSKEVSDQSPLFNIKWAMTDIAGEAIALAHILKAYAVAGEEGVIAMPLRVRTVLRNKATGAVDREVGCSTEDLYKKYGGTGCIVRARSMYIESRGMQAGLETLCMAFEQAAEEGVKAVMRVSTKADGTLEA